MKARDEYIKEREHQLREWNAQLKYLRQKSERHSQVLIKRWAVKIRDLHRKRLQLQAMLEGIKHSGEDTFDNLRQDTELLWQDVRRGFSELRVILK